MAFNFTLCAFPLLLHSRLFLCFALSCSFSLLSLPLTSLRCVIPLSYIFLLRRFLILNHITFSLYLSLSSALSLPSFIPFLLNAFTSSPFFFFSSSSLLQSLATLLSSSSLFPMLSPLFSSCLPPLTSLPLPFIPFFSLAFLPLTFYTPSLQLTLFTLPYFISFTFSFHFFSPNLLIPSLSPFSFLPSPSPLPTPSFASSPSIPSRLLPSPSSPISFSPFRLLPSPSPSLPSFPLQLSHSPSLPSPSLSSLPHSSPLFHLSLSPLFASSLPLLSLSPPLPFSPFRLLPPPLSPPLTSLLAPSSPSLPSPPLPFSLFRLLLLSLSPPPLSLPSLSPLAAVINLLQPMSYLARLSQPVKCMSASSSPTELMSSRTFITDHP
ncbi:hypothetical protein C7M84_019961 [Penaeus vannamei]|uniref:Uncharacterized protein n=1 Tax=Penaeus vannamei TaxID=6689 RepID=A0A3R7P637_PENVA|nr:hypothetical protein C7M84_019961 [Penaeus vannamei]